MWPDPLRRVEVLSSEQVARLSDIVGGGVRQLKARTLVGRSSICVLRLEQSDVSKEHAVLSWSAGGWTVRDLGSRNGTFSNGLRIEPGEECRLERGSELRFGRKSRWLVTDTDPPPLSAQTVDEGEPLWVSGAQMLAFQAGEELRASVSRDQQGCWLLESDRQVAIVRPGETFVLDGRRWRLNAPSYEPSTESVEAGLRIVDSRLSFMLSAGRLTRVRVLSGAQTLDFTARGHHHLLHALAVLRLAAVEEGVADHEAGWMSHAELRERIGSSRNHVNVNVHRARKQLEEAGFVDAACLIERRHGSGKLRIGVRNLRLEGVAP